MSQSRRWRVRVAVPVDDALAVQVLEAEEDLGGVEARAALVEALADAVLTAVGGRVVGQILDVELEVAAVHQREHQTQRVFAFERVREVHLQVRWRTTLRILDSIRAQRGKAC